MRELTFGEAIHEALREEMLRDPTVYIVGEDVGLNARPPKASAGLYEEFFLDFQNVAIPVISANDFKVSALTRGLSPPSLVILNLAR